MKRDALIMSVIVFCSSVLMSAQSATSPSPDPGLQQSAADNSHRSLSITPKSENSVVADSKPKREQMVESENADDPVRRETEFWKERTYPFDKIPDGAVERAIAKQKQMLNRKGSASLLAASPTWKPIGPGNIGGRTRSIACDPKNDGVVYAAAAGGGVWKSTDHGAVWTPIFDNQNSISMGALAIDPNNSSIIYAATGEMVNGSSPYGATGTGVYKSVDAGSTWKLMGLTTVGGFSKIFVHPMDSKLIYAGGTRSSPGVYRSKDAGVTWQRLNRYNVSDLTINPSDPNEIYFGAWGVGVFHSTNGGDSSLATSAGFPDKIGRVSVQLAPSNPKRLYCLTEGTNPGIPTIDDTVKTDLAYILVSDDGGKTWQMNDTKKTNFFTTNITSIPGQGWYDNFVIVHPTNPDLAYIGGIDFYLTTNGGKGWTNISNSYSGGGVHPDQQAGMFNPMNPDEVYMANDGGVYRSASLSDPFLDINNNYQVTAYYALAIDHTAENKTYGGSQDNGTSGSTNATTDWRGYIGGDGFYVALSSIAPHILYGETPNGAMVTRNMNTGQLNSNVGGIPSDDAEGAWSSPIVLEPASAQLYHGRKRVYVQAIGTTGWTPFSTKLDTSSFVCAIGPSSVDDNYLYAGFENGNLFRTSNGGDKWTNVTLSGLPKRYIKDIIPSRLDPKTVWVCYSGYGTGHVFQSTDAGLTWKDCSTTLPDIPVNAICVNPDNEKIIFAGTDIGVFATFNNGDSWLPFGKGMPRAPVVDMEIYEEKSLLRVATHGRSMWEVSIPSEDIDEPEITSPSGGEIAVATSSIVFSWHGFNGPVNVDITYSDQGNYWYRIASGVVGGSMLWMVENRPTCFARIRVSLSTSADISVISNTFTINEFTRGSVKEASSFSHVAYGLAYDGNNGLWTTSFYTNEVFKLDANSLQMIKSFTMPKGNDKNFTDMAMDRDKGQFYIHRLNSQTAGSASHIVVVDTTGVLIRSMISPAAYGIGLELINNKLIVGERDGSQLIYECNPLDAETIYNQVQNPFRKNYGPRCMSYDGKGTIFQVGTDFTGGAFLGAYLSKIPLTQLNKETDQMELKDGAGSSINARGIEFDPRDGNYWITDLSGNVFKIANFDTPSNPLSDVSANQNLQSSGLVISPNPARERAVIGFMTGQLQANVRLEVFNIIGEKVETLVDGMVSADENSAAILDCSSLPNGLYTVVLSVDGITRPSQKLIVSK